MNEEKDWKAIGRGMVDDARYITIATADSSGQPWATPVYFAHRDYRDFFWVSVPEATHSRNLRDRREVGIVVFDSSARIGEGFGAVYISGVARELPAHEAEEGIAIFSERSLAHGGVEWTAEDVREPARHRLYQATAEAVYVLDEHDQRVEVDLS